ncbi:hypothetical protein [Microvirga massiliensis]|uniref:hypothetical protein n=1 Tax=Microvirga massiliensis TaxID=1033741 RepID=UPI0011CBFB51|nr:hypothetical protein [Microvirga massiliensis]
MFVIVFAAMLASAATFLALLPFGWVIGLAAAPVGGSIAGLLSGIVIARLASTSRESTGLRWSEGQPARKS